MAAVTVTDTPTPPGLNVELLHEVADIIELHDRFSMETYFSGDAETAGEVAHKCGSTACVAGWTVALVRPTLVIEAEEGADTHDVARKALNLTSEQAYELFLPGFLGGRNVWRNVLGDTYWGDATSVQAAKLLRGLASGEYAFACDEGVA